MVKREQQDHRTGFLYACRQPTRFVGDRPRSAPELSGKRPFSDTSSLLKNYFHNVESDTVRS